MNTRIVMSSASLILIWMVAGCSFPTITHNQADVIIDEIDIPASLRVAACELNRDSFDNILGLWVLRDQRIGPDDAKTVSRLYFEHVDSIESDFAVWHLTWAVSNLYRNGNADVKAVLKAAYEDATKRASALGKEKADEKVNGDKVYMGFSHIMGYRYAKQHIVAPGNKRYLQRFEDYRHADTCQ